MGSGRQEDLIGSVAVQIDLGHGIARGRTGCEPDLGIRVARGGAPIRIRIVTPIESRTLNDSPVCEPSFVDVFGTVFGPNSEYPPLKNGS